jgi:hypothetical protein
MQLLINLYYQAFWPAGPLVGALLAGLAVGALYGPALGKTRAEARPFGFTLVLLTVLTAAAALMIGDNVARAFGLVGALSIVRFRTVVDDTRDTAFVVFAVVCGMAFGSGAVPVACATLVVGGGAALVLGRRARAAAGLPAASERRLLVRVGAGADPDAAVGALLRTRDPAVRLLGAAAARQGAALDVRYALRLADAESLLLVRELNALDAVQHVELEAD